VVGTSPALGVAARESGPGSLFEQWFRVTLPSAQRPVPDAALPSYRQTAGIAATHPASATNGFRHRPTAGLWTILRCRLRDTQSRFMNPSPELVPRPHYPALLLTAVLMGAGAYALLAGLLFLMPELIHNMPAEDVWLASIFVLPMLIGTALTCVAGLLDVVRAALTGLRPAWQVRISHEGIHHPLLQRDTIRWDAVEDMFVSSGFNGTDIWFTLKPPLWHIGLINVFVTLLNRRRFSYVRFPSHRFHIDRRTALQTLHDLMPERLRG